MNGLSEAFSQAVSDGRALTFSMQVSMNCLNRFSVNAGPTDGAGEGAGVKAQETVSVGVLVPLLSVSALPVSSFFLAGGEFRQKLRQVGEPVI